MRMRSQLEMASCKRKSNFGQTEIMTLLDGVADNKRLLPSSFGTDVTNKTTKLSVGLDFEKGIRGRQKTGSNSILSSGLTLFQNEEPPCLTAEW